MAGTLKTHMSLTLIINFSPDHHSSLNESILWVSFTDYSTVDEGKVSQTAFHAVEN